MVLNLHTIKPSKGATKKRKRVGRGNASGHGTYSCRGLKGQRSRSGGKSGLKRLGMKTILRNIPKKRGFKSKRPKNQIVNLAELNKYFKDGDEVNPKSLLKAGLIDTIQLPIKVLGNEAPAVKGLKFKSVKVSESVKKKLELRSSQPRQAKHGKQN